MVSITFSVDNKILSLMKQFSWINWSEVAREKLNKKRIFEEYLKNKQLSNKDLKFCDKIDWHPVDEFPMKPEYIERLKKIEKEPHSKMSLKELDKLLGLK